MPKIKAPANLGAAATKMWDDITSTYDLRVDELRVLEDACRETDLIDRLEADLRGASLTVKGSQGQPVANPLVQEIRQHRATVQRLFGSLKLPDENGESPAANKARMAANVRWGNTG